METSIQKLLERLNTLEEDLKKTKADVAASEERAARAEARADRLENATGNIAAAVINPKTISRRKLLLKAAGVGAAGVAGSLLINRPKDALAAFPWNGGTTNAADLPTTVTAALTFPDANSVLTLQGNGGSTGSLLGNALDSIGMGSGYGLYAQGGRGPVGGVAIQAYGGPGRTAMYVAGDFFGDNIAIPANGIRADGNGLGVGGRFSGGRAQIQLASNSGVGAPVSGQHFNGDLYMDAAMIIWGCTLSGTPGTFRPLQPGGMNSALFTAVSTQQYPLNNSDGVTWTPMDPTKLKLTITPTFNCQAWINASADLWTATSGFNQDIGISVAGTAYPTAPGQPEAWKESGGSAGTFSPNAAHVDTIVPLAASVTYTIQLVWKTNHSGTSMIAAGAGPIGGKYSPTRLTAWLVPTNPGGL